VQPAIVVEYDVDSAECCLFEQIHT
jgi:hypothetical protein